MSEKRPSSPFPESSKKPWQRESFVAFAYQDGVGWWRRVGDFHALGDAQAVAEWHAVEGNEALVMRQVVTFGEMEQVFTASPVEKGSSPGGAR